MTDLFTVQKSTIGRAPARIDLLGDKTKRPESAQHIITFPGGAIELSRTSDGSYWAHILVNRGWVDGDQEGYHAARGQVIDSRIGRDLPAPGHLTGVDNQAEITQIAVLIGRVSA